MFDVFKKVLSALLSLAMIILSAFGIGKSPVTDAMKVGPWLAAICEDFGMSGYESKTPYYENITADNEYFAAVQTAYEWGIVDKNDKINVDAPLTNEFAAKCLVKAARLEAEKIEEIKNAGFLDYAEEVAIAVANGLFDLAASGIFKIENLTVEKALEVLAKAKTIWANQAFDKTTASYSVKKGVKDLTDAEYEEENGKLVYANSNLNKGDVFVNENGAFVVKAVEEKGGKDVVTASSVELEDAVDKVALEGTIDADLDAAKVIDESTGKVIQEYAEKEEISAQGSVGDWVKKQANSLIDKAIDKVKEEISDLLLNPSISFSVKGFKIKAAYSKGTVALSVAGSVADHVSIAKAYSLSNIKFSTKYDADLAKRQINEAYVIANYDLVDTSTVSGSYAAAVVPEEVDEDEFDEPVDFLTRVKEGLFKVKEGSGVKIDVATFSIPVGETGLFVTLKLSVTISVGGTIQVIITSNETKGVEVINNHVRFISDDTVYNRTYKVSGTFQVVLGFYIALNFLGYDIIDAAINGGIGAYVLTSVYRPTGEAIAENLEISEDVLVEATAGNEEFDDAKYCIDIKLYGILKISVGENSLLDKIKLSKSWNIFDMSNGTFAKLHLEDGKLVDKCTMKAA